MPGKAWADLFRSHVRPPLAVALGAPGLVAELLAELRVAPVVCYQMDLYQAERLRAELRQRDVAAEVVAAADLWDLQAEFPTVLYPAQREGERHLKIDMVEQAFHLLPLRGRLLVLSAYERDLLFPGLLKKVFGDLHTTTAAGVSLFWATRRGDRPRRRHEVMFQVRRDRGGSLRFLSRPGVFSYGHFDAGARALVETMQINPGDRLIDLGCGLGTNGILAGLRSGPDGGVVFVDSNLRALVLAEHNARACGLTNFQIVDSEQVVDLAPNFDVVLANPPYYAQGSIAERFIEQARALLRPGGRIYLVTKQADQVGPLLAATFGPTEVVERRGYVVLCATRLAARAENSGCEVR